eukprot:scaffold4880_cov206-Prasinococcus_capsulatus_cf.AAC.2
MPLTPESLPFSVLVMESLMCAYQDEMRDAVNSVVGPPDPSSTTASYTRLTTVRANRAKGSSTTETSGVGTGAAAACRRSTAHRPASEPARPPAGAAARACGAPRTFADEVLQHAQRLDVVALVVLQRSGEEDRAQAAVHPRPELGHEGALPRALAQLVLHGGACGVVQRDDGRLGADVLLKALAPATPPRALSAARAVRAHPVHAGGNLPAWAPR